MSPSGAGLQQFVEVYHLETQEVTQPDEQLGLEGGPPWVPGGGGGGCHDTSDVLPPTAIIINGSICRPLWLPVSGVNCHTTPGSGRPSSSVTSATSRN